jgi:hypothetical protein
MVYPPATPIEGVAGQLEALPQVRPHGAVSRFAVFQELAGCGVQVEVLAEARQASGDLSSTTWGIMVRLWSRLAAHLAGRHASPLQ